MVDLDTLRIEQRAGRVFGGLREGDLSRFAPTYKRIVGEVEGYSRYVIRLSLQPQTYTNKPQNSKRIPGYTDRIMFASFNDPPTDKSTLDFPTEISSSSSSTTTKIHHFSSTESLTLSDHKPVHLILTLPTPKHQTPTPHLAPTLPEPGPPHPKRPEPASTSVVLFWDILGTLIDRTVGWPWFIVVTLTKDPKGMGLSAFLALLWGIWWSGYWSG